MCAFDKDSAPNGTRRRAVLIASFVPIFTSLWLMVLPHHGEAHHPGPLLLGLSVGIAFGIGIVVLCRRMA